MAVDPSLSVLTLYSRDDGIKYAEYQYHYP
jgi:hypothetical protein